MSFRQELKTFIRQNLVNDAQLAELSENESLIERGIIDSMGLMQVIQFIEVETGIRIPDEEVLPENFETIAAIEGTLERLRAKGVKR
jgi:acyl carrier protein